MRLCVIPARGGSKRIPRKNLREFCGRPMIAYSIDCALKSGCFDRVVVSTDDEEIAAVAADLGAEVPFLRPDELAGDYAGTNVVVAHAVDWFTAQGARCDTAACIYATAPFLTPEVVRYGAELLDSSDASFVVTVTSFPFPIQRALRIAGSGGTEMFFPEHRMTRSQDLEEAYHDAGQLYWGRAEAFRSGEPLFSASTRPLVLPRSRVQDIDTPEDWERAEAMYRAFRVETG